MSQKDKISRILRTLDFSTMLSCKAKDADTLHAKQWRDIREVEEEEETRDNFRKAYAALQKQQRLYERQEVIKSSFQLTTRETALDFFHKNHRREKAPIMSEIKSGDEILKELNEEHEKIRLQWVAYLNSCIELDVPPQPLPGFDARIGRGNNPE